MGFIGQQRMMDKVSGGGPRMVGWSVDHDAGSSTSRVYAVPVCQDDERITQKPALVRLAPFSSRTLTSPPVYEETLFTLPRHVNGDIDNAISLHDGQDPPKEVLDGVPYGQRGPNSSFWRTWKGVILLVFISSILIIVAIVGGVCGSRAVQKSSQDSLSASSNSAGRVGNDASPIPISNSPSYTHLASTAAPTAFPTPFSSANTSTPLKKPGTVSPPSPMTTYSDSDSRTVSTGARYFPFE